jgi:hypothetical protein
VHLAVEGLFYGCVAYEYKCSGLEIKVAYDRGMVALEADSCVIVFFVHLVAEMCEVVCVLLKGDCSPHDEVSGGK